VDVVQVGGELGLDVAAGDHVLVGRDDLPPGTEAGLGAAVDQAGGAGLGAGLLGEDLALEVVAELGHLLGLGRRPDLDQQ